MSTLYFASSSANADPSTSGTFKDASTGANATITAGDTIIFDYRGTGKLAPLTTANLHTDKYLAAIIIDKSFLGEIGDGTNYWRVHAAAITAGLNTGASLTSGGAPRVMIQTNKSTAQTSAITRSGATATFTSTAHGLANGATVTISGANQTDYNITAVISNVTADTFDYTVANAPTTPSTGTASFYVPTTVSVFDTSSTQTDSQFPPVQLLSVGVTHNQSGGSVGYAVRTGETSSGTFNVTKADNIVTPVKLYLGPGVTPTAITDSGGYVTNRSDNTATAVTVSGTNTTYESLGSGAHTTLTVGSGAKAIYSGSGNIATLNNQGTFDRTRDTRSITVSTLNVYAGSSTLLNNGKASSTTRSAINLVQCSAEQIVVSTPLGERF